MEHCCSVLSVVCYGLIFGRSQKSLVKNWKKSSFLLLQMFVSMFLCCYFLYFPSIGNRSRFILLIKFGSRLIISGDLLPSEPRRVLPSEQSGTGNYFWKINKSRWDSPWHNHHLGSAETIPLVSEVWSNPHQTSMCLSKLMGWWNGVSDIGVFSGKSCLFKALYLVIIDPTVVKKKKEVFNFFRT